MWDLNFIINGKNRKSRGVAVFFSNNFEYEIKNIYKDTEGNLLVIDIKISDMEILIVNVYGPNQDSPNFYTKIGEIIENSEQEYVLICGDLNMVLDPVKDSQNYININNPHARETFLGLLSQYNLIDTYRQFNPDKKRYTWRKRFNNMIKQARLDYIIASNTLSARCDKEM